MHYKTIVLELIRENPGHYEKLRSGKMLLTAMESYAIELRAAHESWKDFLAKEDPTSNPRQITAEALELAIQEIQASLRCASGAPDEGLFSLDDAMNFIRNPTANA